MPPGRGGQQILSRSNVGSRKKSRGAPAGKGEASRRRNNTARTLGAPGRECGSVKVRWPGEFRRPRRSAAGREGTPEYCVLRDPGFRYGNGIIAVKDDLQTLRR
jgi:hypothetical protein